MGKKNQKSKQKEGRGFFFSFSISSCFFQFLPIFPFFHPLNSSNLNPGVWHWLPWPCRNCGRSSVEVSSVVWALLCGKTQLQIELNCSELWCKFKYCILYIFYWILYNVYWIPCTVYWILYTVYCILFTVYCILYTAYCILYTVYCILYTVYCILYTVYCIL